MTYEEIVMNARGRMGHCEACLICNGKACRGRIPGPGAKGLGGVAIRNYEAWRAFLPNMDTVTEPRLTDTRLRIFGKEFAYPFFPAPVGFMTLHYGDLMNDAQYVDVLVPAAAHAGIAAFTGDGPIPEVMEEASRAIAESGGMGIPTLKPWDDETLVRKYELLEASGAFAVAMDIDAAGLPFLKQLQAPAGRIPVDRLARIIERIGKPFLLKGVMSASVAAKAKAAGAAGVVVSNHGGRVLDGCPATAEVLEEVVAEVGDSMKVFVDGGIRSGLDVFRALALGADAVLVGRPYVTAVYGGAAEGVSVLTAKLGAELVDAMEMCGASSLGEITRDMVRVSSLGI